MLSAFSMGVTGNGMAQVASGEGFGPKLQFGGGVSFDARIPFAGGIGMGASLEVARLWPSDAKGGFLYRGYGGSSLGISILAQGTLVSVERIGSLVAGGAVGAAACFASYEYTTLYYFYPEVRVEGFLDFIPAPLPFLALSVSIPLRVQFRRDLAWSVSTGMGLSVRYVFGSGT